MCHSTKDGHRTSRDQRLAMGPRHPSFDYRRVAAYFVTVCARNRRCLFGSVARGQVHLGDIGTIVAKEWIRSESLRDRFLLDAWVVMPNHLHGIVCIAPPGVDDVSPRGYEVRVGPFPETATDPRKDHVGPTRASDLHRGRRDTSESSSRARRPRRTPRGRRPWGKRSGRRGPWPARRPLLRGGSWARCRRGSARPPSSPPGSGR